MLRLPGPEPRDFGVRMGEVVLEVLALREDVGDEPVILLNQNERRGSTGIDINA